MAYVACIYDDKILPNQNIRPLTEKLCTQILRLFLNLSSLLSVENELLNFMLCFFWCFFFLQTFFFFAKTHSELHRKIKC